MSFPNASSTASGATVLVVGATGGFGRAVTLRLLQQGWRVRALTRHEDMAQRVRADKAAWGGLETVQWHRGDAMNQSDVVAAAQGVQFIVHGANPPGYVRWRELALPMLANSMEAARRVDARLLLPGNVYNFGPDAGELVNEQSPQRPLTRKGAVRVEMEVMLQQAASDPHRPLRSLVLRAGDFFDAHSPSSWFGTLLIKPGKPVRKVVYPGAKDVGHAWAYLPDLAEAAVKLMALDLRDPDRLARFEVLHFGGHWLPQGGEMARAIARAAGDASLPIKALPWPVLRLLSPFVPILREIVEMRYLWRVPLRLDNAKLEALIGPEPHTPLDVAVQACLQGMGCLNAGLMPAKA
ncbi:MAG TPA: NAD-dependent epimerase/dehydratase family protein [Aquabacterium sp.]|uniref:NAD-dependent epimerase/dehydratase family protein n=1 Tax=Aquabacterium sp. TaxID=1872578 RepID=UPI002E31FD03|nr:NAD-dependent epimerase/dehydratase family protein [Aquabacterium sp.]HEX5372204.1 NAD-dependent epimerase/dehydratase family protein [Aquabacterium sp.]